MFNKFLVVLFTHFVGVRVVIINNKTNTNIIDYPHKTEPGSNKIIRFNCEDVRHIVDMHNKVRLMASRGEIEGQPGCKVGLPKMVWSYELQNKAIKWAQLIFLGKRQTPHILLDNVREVPSGRWKITGENIFFISTNDLNAKSFDPRIAVYSWFLSHKFYKKFQRLTVKMFRQTGLPVAGHYTQMVWWTTSHLGCALSQQPITYGKGWNEFFFVCHYAPAGNYIGRLPYLPAWNEKDFFKGNNLTCEYQHPECCCPYGYKYKFNSSRDC